MKLLNKYSKEISAETKSCLVEIYHAMKKADIDIIKKLIDAYKQNKYLESNSIKIEFDNVIESEENDAVNLLYSFCQGTKHGLAIVGVTAIVTSFSKETFEYINSSFDFNADEKETKVKLAKYFKNTSEAKQEQIYKAIFLIKERLKKYNIEKSPMNHLIVSRFHWIAKALSNDFKNKDDFMKDLPIMLSIILSEKEYKSVKAYLGLKNLSSIEVKDREYIIEELLKKPYRQFSNTFGNTVCKIEDSLSEEESFTLAFLSGENTNSIGLIVHRLSSRNRLEITYFSMSLRNTYKQLKAVDFNSSDWEFLISEYKSPLSINTDTSYSAMDESKRYTNSHLAKINYQTYSNMKDWLEKYDNYNIIGRVTKLKISTHENRNGETIYCVIKNFCFKDDKLFVTLIAADMTSYELFIKYREVTDINNFELLSKFEAMAFYSDVQKIEIEKKLKSMYTQMNRNSRY